MPVDAVLVIQVPGRIGDAVVAEASDAFAGHFELDEDDLRFDPPLTIRKEVYESPFLLIAEADRTKEIEAILVHPEDTWVGVNYRRNYYGRGYERGYLPLIVQIAEWLESRFPGGRVWYGGDSSCIVRPFGPAERRELMRYYEEVGHEPYRARFRPVSADVGEN